MCNVWKSDLGTFPVVYRMETQVYGRIGLSFLCVNNGRYLKMLSIDMSKMWVQIEFGSKEDTSRGVWSIECSILLQESNRMCNFKISSYLLQKFLISCSTCFSGAKSPSANKKFLSGFVWLHFIENDFLRLPYFCKNDRERLNRSGCSHLWNHQNFKSFHVFPG